MIFCAAATFSFIVAPCRNIDSRRRYIEFRNIDITILIFGAMNLFQESFFQFFAVFFKIKLNPVDTFFNSGFRNRKRDFD